MRHGAPLPFVQIRRDLQQYRNGRVLARDRYERRHGFHVDDAPLDVGARRVDHNEVHGAVQGLDDDIRLLAAKCISKVAISVAARPHLAIPQVLYSFRSLVEHGMVVNDTDQLRAALDAMCTEKGFKVQGSDVAIPAGDFNRETTKDMTNPVTFADDIAPIVFSSGV